MLFAALGYHRLLSRFVAHSKKKSVRKQERSAFQRLVCYVTVMLGTWILVIFVSLSVLNSAFLVMISNQTLVKLQFPKKTFLNSLMDGRYELDTKDFEFKAGNKIRNNSGSCKAASSIVTLARLDAFVATTIPCLWDGWNDNVNGHRQKLY